MIKYEPIPNIVNVDDIQEIMETNKRVEQENIKLNNIINEYEKWLKAHLDEEFYWFKMYDKLQELNGDRMSEIFTRWQDPTIKELQNQLEEKIYLYNKLDTESKYVINNLQKQLQQKENIIKEVREYIERYLRLNLEAFDTKDLLEKFLEILDKENI